MTSELTPEQRTAFTLDMIERRGLDETRRLVGGGYPSASEFADISLLRRPTETCRHCAHPIATLGGRWTHTDTDGLPLMFGRKCRSASWTRMSESEGYDPGLDKNLRAAALPGVRRPKEEDSVSPKITAATGGNETKGGT